MPEDTPRKTQPAHGDWWLWAIAAGAAVVLLAAAVGVTVFVVRRKAAADIAAPAFVLRDEQGRLTSLAEFRGKVVALTFIDPVCTDLCPLTSQSMVRALDVLGPAAASRVQLLAIDANPQKTAVADVASYTRAHRLEGRWRFLTGSREQLEAVWHAYHVYVAVANDDIQHTAVVFLIDPDGNEQDTYSTAMSYEAIGNQARDLARGITRLLPAGAATPVVTQAPAQQTHWIKPTETVSLAGFDPTQPPELVGGAHARLMVFFAGWLGAPADLSRDLSALDGYAAQARQHGWPPPLAIDELTTEPSADEAKGALAPLAAALRTPIVLDTDGQLADAYEVEDLPWFVLSSPLGKVLWSHDGWLPTDALIRDVRGALPAR